MSDRTSFSLHGAFDTNLALEWTAWPSPEGGEIELKSLGLDEIEKARNDLMAGVDAINEGLNPRSGHTSEQLKEAIAALEPLGRAFSEALFGQDIPRLEHLIASPGLVSIDVVTKKRSSELPIELCVVKGPNGSSAYLGDLCIVVRRPPVRRPYREHLDDLDRRTGAWRMSYAEDGTLESSAEEHGTPGGPEHELHALSPITENIAHRLDFLKQLDPRQPARKQQRFTSWVASSGDVMHFNTHSVVDEVANTRKLQVSDKARVGPDDFEQDGPLSLTYDTAVFLNSCTSLRGPKDWTNSMAVRFLEAKAGAVVCTTWFVDDRLGTAFAKAFYKALAVPGTTIVRAMLDARRSVSAELKHPLANLYTLVGNENFAMRDPKDAEHA